MAARVVAGGVSPATVWRKEALGRLIVIVRCLCARRKGGKRSGEGESMERSSPVSSVVLWRAIPKEGRLTVAKWREHGVRGVKAKLQARWSGRRRAVVDGRAKSGEGAGGGRWRVRTLVLSEREAKGGAGNAMPGELCGSLSRGQQCQDYRGAWTRSQAVGDGWRHAAGKP